MINYLNFRWHSHSERVARLAEQLNEERQHSLSRKSRTSLIAAFNSIITTINVLLIDDERPLVAILTNTNAYRGKSQRNPAYGSEVLIALRWLRDKGYLSKVQGVKAVYRGNKPTGSFTPFIYEVSHELILNDLDMTSVIRNPLLSYIDVRIKIKKHKISVEILDDEQLEFRGMIRSTTELLQDYHDLMSKTDIAVWTQHINPLQTSLTLVFSQGSLRKGGRFFCSLQNMKSKARPYIRLNKEPTVEIDFSAIHPNMLYDMTDNAVLKGDAYTIDGFDRADVKVAFNIMLNRDGGAGKSSSARSISRNTDIKYEDAKSLEQAILDKHSPISHHFNTGIGLDLQRIDSDIMSHILDYFVHDLQRPILPIHDSAVVSVRDVENLRLAMEAAYQEVMPNDEGGLTKTLKAIKVNSLPFTSGLDVLIQQSLDGSLTNYDKDYWFEQIIDNEPVQCPEDYLVTDIREVDM